MFNRSLAGTLVGELQHDFNEDCRITGRTARFGFLDFIARFVAVLARNTLTTNCIVSVIYDSGQRERCDRAGALCTVFGQLCIIKTIGGQ